MVADTHERRPYIFDFIIPLTLPISRQIPAQRHTLPPPSPTIPETPHKFRTQRGILSLGEDDEILAVARGIIALCAFDDPVTLEFVSALLASGDHEEFEWGANGTI